MVQRVKSHHYRGQLQSGFQRAGPQISFYVTCYSSLLSDYDFSRCGLRQYWDRQGGVILFASLGSPIIVTPGSHALIICIHGICWGIILFTFNLKNHLLSCYIGKHSNTTLDFFVEGQWFPPITLRKTANKFPLREGVPPNSTKKVFLVQKLQFQPLLDHLWWKFSAIIC